MVRFCLSSIGRKRYFGQTDILLVASEKYRQLPYKNILRVRGNDERFTRLLPPPEGSGFPPMANERILFMKCSKEIEANSDDEIIASLDIAQKQRKVTLKRLIIALP